MTGHEDYAEVGDDGPDDTSDSAPAIDRDAEIARGRRWRNWTIFMIPVALVATICLLVQGDAYDPIPVPATINSKGEIEAVAPQSEVLDADQELYLKVVKRELQVWLQGARNTLPDKRISEGMRQATRFRTAGDSPAEQKLNAFFDKRKFPARDSDTWFSIDIDQGFNQVQDRDHWQVEWTETEHGMLGDIANPPVRWKALINVVLLKELNEQDLTKNPSGLLVEDFTWSPIY